MKRVIIDDEEFVPASECEDIDSPVKIVILQRGWAMVGRLERVESECKLHKPSISN